jgi:kynurenine formamidase
MRITSAVFLSLLFVCNGCTRPPDPSAVFDGTSGEWIDLTYSFSEETIYWPTGMPFSHEEVAYGPSEAGHFYSSYNYTANEHGGTHFDAPIHFAEAQQTAEQISVNRLVGPAVVVDVTANVHPDYQVQVSDLEAWEQVHGPIPDGAQVLIRTGWGDRWPDKASFLGTDMTGPEAVPHLHFPGISPEAAQWLVDERSIDAVGIDTPSIDYGQATLFETHVIMYEAGLIGYENIANLEQLPEQGAFVVALPMKIEGGSGGPLRIVGFVPGGE